MRRVDLAGTGRLGVPGDGAPGVLTAGSLTLEPARHEARVGAMPLGPHADGVPPAGGARPRRRRPRRASPPGARRLAGRAGPRPAVAQAAPRPPARQARGRRRPADRGGPLGGLPHRGRRARLTSVVGGASIELVRQRQDVPRGDETREREPDADDRGERHRRNHQEHARASSANAVRPIGRATSSIRASRNRAPIGSSRRHGSRTIGQAATEYVQRMTSPNTALSSMIPPGIAPTAAPTSRSTIRMSPTPSSSAPEHEDLPRSSDHRRVLAEVGVPIPDERGGERHAAGREGNEDDGHDPAQRRHGHRQPPARSGRSRTPRSRAGGSRSCSTGRRPTHARSARGASRLGAPNP